MKIELKMEIENENLKLNGFLSWIEIYHFYWILWTSFQVFRLHGVEFFKIQFKI